MIFSTDDIHNLRLEMVKKYSKMSKEEADRDFHEHAERTRLAVEKIRKEKHFGNNVTAM